MDELDQRIMSLLQIDGRIPNAEIARKLGVSEGTVRRRVGRLL
ncbi:MAG: AsnC family protein, partial [Chloroflexi bacterium]|nr:AsnC family protein [Chloroflexota bacterium]